MSHTVLSPSAASRWLNCTPSARLEEQFPDRGSVYAAEGTLAHMVAELLLREKLGRVSAAALKKELRRIESTSGELFSSAMLEYAEAYASFVMEQYNESLEHTPDALLFLEQRLDMTDWVPEGFGTGDAVIVADRMLHITDLKYGKGVPVSAQNNRQMMLYALGALAAYGFVYDIAQVRMTIFQPRIDNISTWDMPAEELLLWANNDLRQMASLAFEGKGEFQPGNHCQFCKAKAVCKALADHNLEIAKYEFAQPAVLSDDAVSDILSRAKFISDWLTAVEEYALKEAVENEKQWPGYKLVEGRSVRRYGDEEKVAQVLLSSGHKEDSIFSKKLLGITAMEKEIGKKDFAALLSGLLIKPPGKPTLAPLSDKRPPINSAEAAAADFT